MLSSDWDNRFMGLALHVSTWSKDPSTKVGACVINPEHKTILAVGYNGFPRGIADDDRLNSKSTKYPLIVHAEMNCVYNASFHGISLKGSTFYIYGLPPCSDCTKGIIQSGVSRIVIPTLDHWSDIKSNWVESWRISEELYREAGVRVDFISYTK